MTRPGVGAGLVVALLAHAGLLLSGAGARPGLGMRATDLVLVATLGLGALAILRAGRAAGRHDATTWTLLALGFGMVCLADLVYDVLWLEDPEPPYPSVADVVAVAAFAPMVVGIGLLLRRGSQGITHLLWLDGAIGASATAAVLAGVAAAPVAAATDGSATQVAFGLTSFGAEIVLLVLVGTGLALTGGRSGRAWWLLFAGFSVYALGDVSYAYDSAGGGYVDGHVSDLGWTLGAALVALAARQPPPEPGSVDVTGRQQIPARALAGAAFALLTWAAADHGISPVATGLAALAVVLFGVRSTFAQRELRRLSDSHRQARTDDLTGLLNRRGFIAALDAALTAEPGTRLPADHALLLADLDRFKEINDTLGHRAGDRLLVQLARRLEATLPGAVLARLGGDEFVALVACGPEDATAHAWEVHAAFGEPVVLEGLTTHVQASIGIALCPDHGRRRGELLQRADIAMYRAKQAARGVEVYAGHDGHTRERLALAGDLRRALDEATGLELHYQPKADLLTGTVDGVEALVRWRHPRLGLLAPDEFLDIAEEQALLHRLTLTVLDLALAQRRAWSRVGLELTVAVNITAADLLEVRFPAELAALLERHETPRANLQLELTESTVMRDPGRTLDTLARIGELGVALSLDDFGTGYSSLAHLKRLPVQELKIDRSFVADLLTDRDDAVIVHSTVELGRSLGLRVVGEGVETPAHWERLADFGCHLAQGYLLTRPLPAAALLAWLAGYEPRTLAVSGVRTVDGASTPPLDGAALDALVDVTDAVLAGQSFDAVLATLARALRSVVPVDDVCLHLVDPGGSTYRVAWADPAWSPEAMEQVTSVRDGHTGRAICERRTCNIARTDLDPSSVAVAGTDNDPEAMLVVPLLDEDRERAIGALNLYRLGTHRSFGATDQATVERFARVAALALRARRVPGGAGGLERTLVPPPSGSS